MATTFTSYCDPVTQGATIIQSSNFAFVAADWKVVSYDYLVKGLGKEAIKGYLGFPQSAEAATGFEFWMRADQTSSPLSLTAIKMAVSGSWDRLSRSTATNGTESAFHSLQRLANLKQWFPFVGTKANGQVGTIVVPFHFQGGLPVDTDTGLMASAASIPMWKYAYEGMSVLFPPQAATTPLDTGYQNIAGGKSSL